MLREQEPKFDAVDGRLVNRATGVAIPSDEPVFVLRAKDMYAIEALRAYLRECTDIRHCEAIARRIDQFERFADQHPTRMKSPDTDPSCVAG